MVVGLSSAVSAQTILEDGDGVRLRVTNPDNGGFAGIGDTVEVEVHYLTSIAPTDIRVAIVTDTEDVTEPIFCSYWTALTLPTSCSKAYVPAVITEDRPWKSQVGKGPTDPWREDANGVPVVLTFPMRSVVNLCSAKLCSSSG